MTYTLTVTVTASDGEVVANGAFIEPPPEFMDNNESNNDDSDFDPVGLLFDGFESLDDE